MSYVRSGRLLQLITDDYQLITRRILAANLLRFREGLEMSQEAFAEKLGFHRTKSFSVERSQWYVSVDNLDRIAKALKVKASVLLEE